MASNPVRFWVMAKRPPKVESKKRPLSGDLVAAYPRLVEGRGVSVIGPTAKTTIFSGEKGSIPGFNPSYRILAANPFPPKYFRANASSKF